MQKVIGMSVVTVLVTITPFHPSRAILNIIGKVQGRGSVKAFQSQSPVLQYPFILFRVFVKSLILFCEQLVFQSWILPSELFPTWNDMCME